VSEHFLLTARRHMMAIQCHKNTKQQQFVDWISEASVQFGSENQGDHSRLQVGWLGY